MPTGYTHKITEGQSFEDFVMGCARGFGACITMRDEPEDEPIPEEFKPSEYHQKQIVELNEQLAALDQLSVEDVRQRIASETARIEELNREHAAKHVNEEKTYKAMREKVAAWQSPSSEHDNLKKFMLQQIDDSIKWDCGHGPYQQSLPEQSPAAWLAFERAKLHKDLAYHEVEHVKEVDRAFGRTRWVRQLRESLRTEVAN